MTQEQPQPDKKPQQNIHKLSRKDVKISLKDVLKVYGIYPSTQKNTKNIKSEIYYSKARIDSIGELIDMIRICAKHSVFDIECLKREIKYLCSIIDNNKQD